MINLFPSHKDVFVFPSETRCILQASLNKQPRLAHRSRPIIEDKRHHHLFGVVISLDICQPERPEKRNLAPERSLLQQVNLITTGRRASSWQKRIGGSGAGRKNSPRNNSECPLECSPHGANVRQIEKYCDGVMPETSCLGRHVFSARLLLVERCCQEASASTPARCARLILFCRSFLVVTACLRLQRHGLV